MTKPGKPNAKETKAAALAEALRANLRRRRAQAQAREADPDASTLSFREAPIKPAKDAG
jgi:hypothetical protein